MKQTRKKKKSTCFILSVYPLKNIIGNSVGNYLKIYFFKIHFIKL